MCQEKMEHPKILLIDVEDEVKEMLESKNYNVDVGSFGTQYRVPKSDDYSPVICNGALPHDLREKEIIIIDLKYDPSKTLSKPIGEKHTSYGENDWWCSCKDGVVCSQIREATQCRNDIDNILNNKGILIVFSDFEILQDNCYNTSRNIRIRPNRLNFSNFSFTNVFNEKGINFKKKSGNEIIVKTKNQEIAEILKGSYGTVIEFNEEEKGIISLAENKFGECVSCSIVKGDSLIIIFPQLKNKKGAIETLFNGMLQEICPQLFPNSTEFHWLENEMYFLPNQKELLKEKVGLEVEYDEKVKDVEKRIEDNHLENKWLHDLIKETGDELVKSVKTFLEWVGFEKVISVDDEKDDLLEEDLRVEGEKILLIEAKGIGGTSKDNECSQIDKIVNRRMRDLRSTEIYGLYIVNHQRYQPPVNRSNPPFSEDQIRDAELASRGMTTTWELFQSYSKINEGVLLKEDIRESFYQTGLIKFQPSDKYKIGEVKEIHHKGEVIVFDLNGSIKVGDEIIVESKNEGCIKVSVESIKLDNKSVDKAESGEVGLKISGKSFKGSGIWKY